MTRDIRAELRQEHLERKDAQARLETLRLEAKAQAQGLSVQRIVWEERREVRQAEHAAHEARMRLKHKLELERRAFRDARIRELAANGFNQVEIAAEVGETRGVVDDVLRPAAVAVGDHLGDRCSVAGPKPLSVMGLHWLMGGEGSADRGRRSPPGTGRNIPDCCARLLTREGARQAEKAATLPRVLTQC